MTVTPVSARIGEIAKRCEAATPGEWCPAGDEQGEVIDHHAIHSPSWGALAQVVTIVDGEPSAEGEANLEFIAHAREDIPYLLSLVAQYREAMEPFAKAAEQFAIWPDGKCVLQDDGHLKHVMVGDLRRAAAILGPSAVGCRADRDGDCTWKDCPQLRDNEPHASGRHCPLDREERQPMTQSPDSRAGAELLACPFCGSTDIDPQGWASQVAYGPQCNDCGATAENPAAWNTRAALTRVPQPAAEGGVRLNETGGAQLLANGHLGCIDCGEQYGSLRFPDLVIDHVAFAEIAPNPPDGGLVCPNCINARLERAGFAYGSVRARFTSGPMAEDFAAALAAPPAPASAEVERVKRLTVALYHIPTPEEWQAAAILEACARLMKTIGSGPGDDEDNDAYQREFAALQAAPAAGDVERALRQIHDTFAADLKQGYRTRDKEFTVEVAAFALKHAAPPPAAPAVAEAGAAERDSRQRTVAAWCAAAFGEGQASSIEQRGIRLLEEAIEAYQACSASADMAHKMVDYIFARPAGTIAQELGGVGVTTLALANAAGVSADDCEAKEVARVLAKPLSHFAARNQAKNNAGFRARAAQRSADTQEDA